MAAGSTRCRAAGTRRPGCPGTWTSSRRRARPSRRGRTPSPSGTRRSAPGRGRRPSRGAGRPGRSRRPGRRSPFPGGPARWPRTRCASRAAPGRGCRRPSSVRPRGPPATGSGPAGSSSPGGPGRRRVRPTAGASRRRPGWTPCRSAGPTPPRSRRRPPARTPLRRPAAARPAGRSREWPRRRRCSGRGKHPQGRHVLAEEVRLALREPRPVLAVPRRPLQERVVDVRDVLDVVDLALRVEPHALHEVERVVGGRVPHVGGVVGSDPAHVDAGDRTGLQGYRAAGRGVVEA